MVGRSGGKQLLTVQEAEREGAGQEGALPCQSHAVTASSNQTPPPGSTFGTDLLSEGIPRECGAS